MHAFGFGEIDGELFLAMQYVEGEPLSRVLAAGKTPGRGLDPVLVAWVLAEACDGLHAAHELRDESGRLLRVVHRDVSPHNVMISYDGNVKVVDFGVARFDTGGRATRTGEVKGKMAYMSPEQALGEELDRRSDLFSVGAMLFECLTGRRMWGEGTDLELMRKIALERPPRLDAALPGAPPALVELQAAAGRPGPRGASPDGKRRGHAAPRLRDGRGWPDLPARRARDDDGALRPGRPQATRAAGRCPARGLPVLRRRTSAGPGSSHGRGSRVGAPAPEAALARAGRGRRARSRARRCRVADAKPSIDRAVARDLEPRADGRDLSPAPSPATSVSATIARDPGPAADARDLEPRADGRDPRGNPGRDDDRRDGGARLRPDARRVRAEHAGAQASTLVGAPPLKPSKPWTHVASAPPAARPASPSKLPDVDPSPF